MRTFIANFGRENYEWPACLDRGSIATMNDVSVQGYWEAGDRESYIRERMKGTTWAGIKPTRAVASRWFNLMSIVPSSSGDLWIHREKDSLWWTISRSGSPVFEQKRENVGAGRDVVVCHKPCDKWSNKNREGNRLDWDSLHPKAREFLATESTLQQLGEDNAAYASALINGDDLRPWHELAAWQAKVNGTRSKRGPATIFNARQRAAARMVMTAFGTAANANGQQVLRTVKSKDVLFSSQPEFEKYVLALIDLQEGRCAITGLALQYDGEYEDAEMLCSLDRIDSARHYEEGNLQVVCRFVNRWKRADDNEEFRRLVGVLRSIGGS